MNRNVWLGGVGALALSALVSGQAAAVPDQPSAVTQVAQAGSLPVGVAEALRTAAARSEREAVAAALAVAIASPGHTVALVAELNAVAPNSTDDLVYALAASSPERATVLAEALVQAQPDRAEGILNAVVQAVPSSCGPIWQMAQRMDPVIAAQIIWPDDCPPTNETLAGASITPEPPY